MLRPKQALRTVLAACLLLLAGAASGCKDMAKIPGTEVPDTEENRQVLQTLERYRIAMVQRDPTAVLATVHPTYFDTSGTDDPIDDVTYAELGPILRRRLAQLQAVRYTIDYLEVSVERDRAVVRAWIDASFRILPPEAEGDAVARVGSRYSELQDFNMFELVREGKSWLITSGL